MQAGVITKEKLENLRTLLLPGVADAIERGVPITALAAADGELAAGALAGWVDNGIFWIISLFVAPEYRRHGCAGMLIESLIPILKEEGIEKMAACFAALDDDGASLIPFFCSMDFEESDKAEENTYLIDIDDLCASPFFSKADGNCATFADVDERVLENAQKKAAAESLPVPAGGLTDAETDRLISTLQVKDSEVSAYVVWDHSCMGKLTLAGAWTEESDPAVLPALLRASFVKIRETYPEEKELIVQAATENSVTLVKRLAPNAKPVERTFIKYII